MLSQRDLTKIAASFNYCFIGAAPKFIDPEQLQPELVEKEASEIPGAVIRFPPSHLCEVRADWKFMKASWL